MGANPNVGIISITQDNQKFTCKQSLVILLSNQDRKAITFFFMNSSNCRIELYSLYTELNSSQRVRINARKDEPCVNGLKSRILYG